MPMTAPNEQAVNVPTPPAGTSQIFEHLKRCASEMRTVTYGELAEISGLAAQGTNVPLGYIRDHVCRARGLPWLNALAVNKASRRPGDSFLPAGVAMGKDDELLWRGMVLQVFAFDWSTVSL
jgi:hypothetical protein